MMLLEYSLYALQKTLQVAISLDERVPNPLIKLAGKILEINLLPFQINFFLKFADSNVEVLDHCDEPVTAKLASNVSGLFGLALLSNEESRALFHKNVTISGDAEFGQAVKQWLNGFDIDWEGQLAKFVGDALAYKLGSIARQNVERVRATSTSFRRYITEYLQEELRAVPSREEIEDFFADIDELSLRVERLAAHVEQILK